MSVPAPIERARAAMRKARVDAVLVASPGNVAFLTGHVIDARLAMPSRDTRIEKPTVALVTAEHAVTVGFEPQPTVGSGISYRADAVGQHESPKAFAAVGEALDALGLWAGTVAVEGAYVPSAVVELAATHSPDLSWRPLDRILRGARASKDAGEIEGIGLACRVADAAQEALRSGVEVGATEADLYALAVAGGCQEAAEHVIVGGEVIAGPRTGDGMGRAGPYRLQPGDLVMSDLFPRHTNGFWADTCLTVCCGEPSRGDLDDAQRLREAIDAGREMLRPGVKASAVYDAVAAVSGPLPAHAGHGIGRDHYEDPVLVPGNEEELQAGATIVLEPGRYRPGRGMRLEWAFEVTEDGGEPLSRFALEIERQER